MAASSARGTPIASSSPSSHSSVPRSIRSVRLALVASVTWTPARCQASQLSTVPAASSPASARARAPGSSSSSHESFGPEKYVASGRPVCSRKRSSAPSAATRSALRASCHTIALASGRPVSRSHSTTVSRWFAMPIAATSPPRAPAAARASSMHVRERASNSSASCSTQPGRGVICRCGCWALATARPARSKSTQRVLVVPWSSAAT